MAKNLVIVESPAKAKTIEGFLGKEYVVKSSFGHVRDLAKSGLAIDIDNGFTPNYAISEDKTKIVNELKKLSSKSEMIWLATDEDREGEAISWHLKEALDLPEKKIKRITFNEITKTAIVKAINNPRKIDKHLVDAQQARRVLDRLVGFELSPLLWKKVKPSLSAGRVQSVAVRIIVEREREIRNFKSETYYRFTAEFLVNKKAVVKAELNKRFPTKKEASAFLEKCKSADFKIADLVTKPSKKSPAAPFTTSTLQQEASRKLGFSVARTMSVAQKLYEAGLITYMRTDSVNLSDTAMVAAKDEIVKSFGSKYANPKKYVTKAKGAQEAHEAIRPTYMNKHKAGNDASEEKLYDLIWKRTLASQMADALLEKTTATISISTRKEEFIAQGEVLKFDGFLKVYLEGSDDEEEDATAGMLPPMKKGEKLIPNIITGTQRFTHHPSRYTEASLVKKLEELGIGRPSTYAPTISTIQKRGYVEKTEREGVKRNYDVLELKNNKIKETVATETTGAEKNKLFPTDIGEVVNDFLVQYFEDILDYGFTASVEKEFDDIAQGMIKWNEMIRKFYKPFHKDVEKTLVESEKATGERILGKDPKTKKTVLVRIGRFGPMVQIGEQNDEEKPRYASLLKTQSIQTITLDEAMELFKLPRDLGQWNGKKVVANIGRFGPYVAYDGTFASLKKDLGDEPMSITLERAKELIEAKKKADLEKIIASYPENKNVMVLKGRWGAFIKAGKKNVRIPKDMEPSTLTLDDCLRLINGGEEPTKKAASKKTTAKKSTTKKKATTTKKAVAKRSTAKTTTKKVVKKAATKAKKKATTKKKK